MKLLLVLTVAAMVALGAAAEAQVKIETTPPKAPPKPPEARIVPPPLHYEQTRPRDADFYPYGTKVEHDPAFIEPFAGSYQTSGGTSGRFGLSGWTAPNAPVGSEATLARWTPGWFALGFSVTWDGPPVRPAAAPRPPR